MLSQDERTAASAALVAKWVSLKAPILNKAPGKAPGEAPGEAPSEASGDAAGEASCEASGEAACEYGGGTANP